MNSQNINIISGGLHSDFVRVQDALRKNGYGNPDRYITQEKTLRVEQLLSSTRASYDFNLYETPGAGRPQEIKLNRNDLFFISHISVGVYKQDAEASPAVYSNPIYTFPDPNYFLGVSGGVNEWDCLETVYSGKCSLFTDPVQRIRDFSTLHFRYVPRRPTLESAFVGITNDIPPQYGPDLEGRGFYKLSYFPALYGQQNNRFTLELGNGNQSVIAGGVDGAGEAVDTLNVLTVLLHGFNVENGAESLSQWGAKFI